MNILTTLSAKTLDNFTTVKSRYDFPDSPAPGEMKLIIWKHIEFCSLASRNLFYQFGRKFRNYFLFTNKTRSGIILPENDYDNDSEFVPSI